MARPAHGGRPKKPERKKVMRRPPPPPLGNQRALGNEGGRPTLFRPEFVDQVRQLCQLGATDAELAQFFEVNRSTIFEWRAAHPEFSDALKIGKSFADERMKRSLYQRGIGYEYQSVKIVEEGVIGDKSGKLTLVKRTTSTEHVAGDVGAQKLWLTNRLPREWRDKIDVSQAAQPERSSAEIKEIILQKLAEWGLKVVPADAPLLESVKGGRLASPASQVPITKAPT
jgi:hypothetical protein